MKREMARLPIPKDPGLAFSFATLVSFTGELGCKVTEFHKEQGAWINNASFFLILCRYSSQIFLLTINQAIALNRKTEWALVVGEL